MVPAAVHRQIVEQPGRNNPPTRAPAAEQPAKNHLTRAEVAARLGVSTSTVRRYEGELLHPEKGADGVNRFDPAEVAALAMTLLGRKPLKASSKQPRTADKVRTTPRTPGDIAAEVFERWSSVNHSPRS